MKLDELRARQRAKLLAGPASYEPPPTMTQELWGMLDRVSLKSLGIKPLKGSREHRLLGCLEKLEMVILSANGYYMMRGKGRQALDERTTTKLCQNCQGTGRGNVPSGKCVVCDGVGRV